MREFLQSFEFPFDVNKFVDDLQSLGYYLLAFVPPPGLFRLGATYAVFRLTIDGILGVDRSPVYDPYGGYHFWAKVAFWFIGLGLLRSVLAWIFPGMPRDLPETGKRSLLLNLVCFLLPPVGLVSWLAWGGKNRRMARQAGRSAVRGAMVMLVAGQFLLLTSLVNIALGAIAAAIPTPMTDSWIRLLARDRSARHQFARAHGVSFSPRPFSLPLTLQASFHKSNH